MCGVSMLSVWTELRAVFGVFDVDRDGFITVEEVFKVLESMGFLPSPSSIDDIFRQVDLDGSTQLLTSEHSQSTLRSELTAARPLDQGSMW